MDNIRKSTAFPIESWMFGTNKKKEVTGAKVLRLLKVNLDNIHMKTGPQECIPQGLYISTR